MPRLRELRRALERMEDFLPRAKKSVSLRLDADVLDWFKSRGRGGQTRMNAVLKACKEARAEADRVGSVGRRVLRVGQVVCERGEGGAGGE